MPLRDPALGQKLLAAMAGGALYGLYNLAILLKDERRPSARDWALLAINLACAIICGLLLTFMFADRMAAAIPWPSLKDVGLISFAFGAFGWELLPLLFPKALRWASRKADEVTGGEGSGQ